MEMTKIYRVQKRKFSPDVVEKNIGTIDEPKWKVYLVPIGNRKDIVAGVICEFLNSKD